MALSDFFKNSFETSDYTSDIRLKSHYYGSDYQTTQNGISSALGSIGYKVKHIDNQFCEMLFESKKAQVILTLSKISLYETCVDIKINTHYLISFGRGIKLIEEIYQLLDRKLTLKRKGGNGE